MKFRIITVFVLLFSAPNIAHACINPTGEAGDQVYNTTHNVMQYCNGSQWVAMGSVSGQGDNLGDHKADSALDLSGFKIQNLATPTSNADAVTKQYADTEDAKKVSKSGDTMTGHLSLSGAPTANAHAASKEYVDTVVAGAAGGGGRPVYMGPTSASFNGNLGGIAGAHAKCNADYPGSRMMATSDIIKADYTQATMSVDGWLYCDEMGASQAVYSTTTQRVPYCRDMQFQAAYTSMNSNQQTYPGCIAHTSGAANQDTESGGYYTMTRYQGVSSINGNINIVNCNTTRQIHCVKD